MKTILLLFCVASLFTTTGCLVSESRGHGHCGGHGGYYSHSTVVVGPPPVVVHAPVVELRPPEIIVR